MSRYDKFAILLHKDMHNILLTMVTYQEGKDDTLTKGNYMLAWIVLLISGVLEAVWATALGKSEGLTKLPTTIVFIIALVASMAGLAYAMRTLPVGTSYAVWVGVGAVLTIVYAMITGTESASLLKVILLLLIVIGIVGLKLLHN